MGDTGSGQVGGYKMPVLVVPSCAKQLRFLVQPFRVFLWLSFVLFSGFTVVHSREEQKEVGLCHHVTNKSHHHLSLIHHI